MKGKVYLVGAGPGDYKLLTLKGLECVKNADIIVYDRLANERILKDAKEKCQFIYVGKESRFHTKTQDEINEIIAQEALSGKVVVRLKGGDPYVFGRGGEEGEYLRERGISFEVVPGITSAIGGLCYAGIPITHRDYASSFHVITGHLKEEEKELDWKNLAGLQGTLVFLMGVSNLKNICTNLVKEGKDKETPAAIINWAARPYQKVVTGTLETIYDVAIREKIKSPSLIVIGGVVNLRESLNFYEEKPLFGKNIVVTRARTQSSKLLEKISDLGGNPIEIPAIKIRAISPNAELEKAIMNLENYTNIVFTSENSVEIFFNNLFNFNRDLRALGSCKVSVIGAATGKALREKGIIADIIPKQFVAESLIEELKKNLTSKDNVLIPRAKEARTLLVDEISNICPVHEVKIYETIMEDMYEEDLKQDEDSIYENEPITMSKEEILNELEENNIDYITFTSSSTVKNFINLIGKNNAHKLKNVKIISIGPVTSKTIESFDLMVYKEATEYTIDGIIDTLINDVNK